MAQEISSEVGDLVELETPPPITADVQSLGKLLRTVNIGSRKSILALIQADLVAGLLKKQNGDRIHFPIHTVMVRGDADKTTPFLQMDKTHGTDAGKNIWTEEMEHMLGTGELDLLVHSLKDLPTALPEKCALGAVIEREDPSDSLVVKPGLSYTSFDQMPDGSVVGTSSTRRKALLKRLYPHLVAKECRGNIDTRLKKLDADDSPFTCILLATAGLVRINRQDRITTRLDPLQFPYAVGQGALGIELRAGDERIQKLVSAIEHKPSRWRCLAERAMLRRLQGGCSSPIGVACFYNSTLSPDQYRGETASGNNALHLTGTIIHPDGSSHYTTSSTKDVHDDTEAEALGIEVAEKLLASGADTILNQIWESFSGGFRKMPEKQPEERSSELEMQA